MKVMVVFDETDEPEPSDERRTLVRGLFLGPEDEVYIAYRDTSVDPPETVVLEQGLTLERLIRTIR